MAAAGSAADAIANAECFDDAIFLEAASAKIRSAEAAAGRRRDRAPGSWRDRLHQRARPASLHAAHAVLARRLRQRMPLGAAARQHGGGARRRRILAAGRLALTCRLTRKGTFEAMTADLRFDQIRLPPECETLRQEVRAFIAEEVGGRHLRSEPPRARRSVQCRLQPPHRREGLDRHDLAEEIRRPRAQLPRALRGDRGIPGRRTRRCACTSSPTARAARSCSNTRPSTSSRTSCRASAAARCASPSA